MNVYRSLCVVENPDILDDMLANLEQENHLLESELNSLQDTNNTQMVLSARDDRMSGCHLLS